MGKTIQILALLGAMMSSQAFAVPGDNPFDKTERIFAGAGSDWTVSDDVLHKSSNNESGTYYHLKLNRQSISLIMSSSADDASAKSYKALAIEDMKIDGRTMPVFKWCLQNQDGQNRFLQQDLAVKMNICENLGEQGEFRVKVNNQTMQALQKGKRLSFKIKPFRSAIEVNFDIENFDDAIAILDAATAPAPVIATQVAAVPVVPAVVKAQPVKMCDATAPQNYKAIRSIRYVCDDSIDKITAEKAIAAAVAKEDQRREKIAQQQEQKRLAALAEKKRQQELLQQKDSEQKAIAESTEKYQIVLDALTKKMLGVCNKMWDRGKHRCYCEKYIEYAPSGIESNPSCSS